LIAVGLVVLVAAYAVAAFLTRGVWADPVSQAGVRATFTAAGPDGAAPSPDALEATKQGLQKRGDDLGGVPPDVVANGDTVTVIVPSADGDVSKLGEQGRQLYVRPVIHAIQAETPPAATPKPTPPPGTTDAKRIADEKTLRQSTEQQIQVLALQF